MPLEDSTILVILVNSRVIPGSPCMKITQPICMEPGMVSGHCTNSNNRG